MRVAVVVAVLGLFAWSDTWAILDWHDDRALWTAAALHSESPRAAINLAVLALKDGDVGAGLTWDADALVRAATISPDETHKVTALIRQHIRWILATSWSTDICDGPPWASYCPSR